MRIRTAALLAVFAASAACNDDGKGDGDSKESKDKDGNKDDKKLSDDDGGAKADSAGGEGGGDDGAGGSDEVSANAVTECPKELKGREKVDRIIKKECGTVKVTGQYNIDDATLVIEGGVTLEVKEGVGFDVGYYGPAKLIIKGTKEEPVTFTSGGDKAPGVWKGITLYGNAARSKIEGMVIEHAGDRNGGFLNDAEDVVVKNSTFRSIKEAGVISEKKGSFAEFSGNTFEAVGRVAMRVNPTIAGDIGEGNTFASDSAVFLKAGKLQVDATWRALNVPYILLGDTQIAGKDGAQATLTIEPGTTVTFDGNAGLGLGYYAEGALKAVGTADKPITFTSDEKEEAGSWRGLWVHSKGEAEFEHVVFKGGGKKEVDGVLLIEGEGEATIKNSSFEKNTVGVVVKGTKSTLEGFDGNTFKETPVAMRMQGRSFGAVGAGNKYEGESTIEIEGGRMTEDATWEPQGAAVVLTKSLNVGGTLEVKAGFELRVKDGQSIDVGYYTEGALKLLGEADKPVKIVGTRDDAGSWKSITFNSKAHGNVLRHVVIRNAGGEAGVVFKTNCDGKVDTLTCEKCSGEALKKADKSNVESTGVKAG